MSVADRVQALELAILEGQDEAPAAAAVCSAVAGGATAAHLVDRLAATLDSMYSPAARADVALALTIDLIRRSEIAAWLALRATWCDELEDALVRADKAGVDVRAAVLALPPAVRHTRIEPAVVRWGLRRKARTRDLVTSLGPEHAVAFVHWVHEKQRSLAPWIGRLGEAVSAVRDPPLRARAAELLRHATEEGCELDAAVREALRAALDDASYYQQPARDAAHALTLAGEALDRDPRAAVRLGAWWGRPSFLGLLDPEPHNRQVIARELLARVAKDTVLGPSRDETRCLFAEVLDPVVAEVLYAVLDRGDVADTVVAGLAPAGAARHLVAAARAVLAKQPMPVCRTCRAIPRSGAGKHVTPPVGLEPPIDPESEGEHGARCLECGATYRVTCYEVGDLFREYEVTIERQPVDDPAAVARWRDRLDHPEPWARRDAAWIVARAAVSSGDTATIDELLAHPDPEVRKEVLAIVPIDMLARALDDPDDTIRSNAAHRLMWTGDAAVLADLLARDPVVASTAAVLIGSHQPQPAAVVQALRARMHAARSLSRPDGALDSVCRLLGSALSHAADPAIVAEAVDIVIGAPPSIQSCVLRVLVGSRPGADTSKLDGRFVALLQQPETREPALHLLAARAQPPRVEELEALAAVRDPDHSALNARMLALFGRAARLPATRAASLRGLCALVDTGIAPEAGKAIHELARELPLGDAVPRLLEIVAARVHGFARQELVRALLVDARRRDDAALVTALVEHRHPGVARLARAQSSELIPRPGS